MTSLATRLHRRAPPDPCDNNTNDVMNIGMSFTEAIFTKNQEKHRFGFLPCKHSCYFSVKWTTLKILTAELESGINTEGLHGSHEARQEL